MKKLFFTLGALCLCGTMWAADDTEAWTDADRSTVYKDTETGLYFYVTGEGEEAYANITWEDGAESGGNYASIVNLTIPATVNDGTNDYPVTRIAPFAFCEATAITGEVVIPANIVKMGIATFRNASNIQTVTYDYSDANLTEENGGDTSGAIDITFEGCSNITTVNINRNISLSNNGSRFTAPFVWQTSVETINIGEHVTSLPHWMFHNNTGTIKTVTSYAINPPSWTYDPFSSVNAECVLYVYASAKEFYGDSNWANIFTNIQTMEDPEEEQPVGTLMDVTTGLFFEIDESTGVVSIIADQKSGAYTDDNLVYVEEGKYYTFPESVIDKTGVGGSVTRIGENAFNGSAISGHLYIPAFITAMGEGSFTGSTHITEVTYEYSDTPLHDEKSDNNERQTQAFYGCSSIVTVNLNRDITTGSTTGLCAPFCWQSTILTINIGPRVTSIPQYMFRDTNNSGHPLSAINVYAAVPPTFDSSRRPFDRIDTYTLSVPQGSEDAYTESVWSAYINSSESSSDTGNCTFTTLSNAYAVDITLSNEDGYYATYYNSKAVDIYPPGGTLTDGTAYDVTTYAASGVDVEGNDAYIVLSEVGATVPEGVAVLVEATAEGTYTVIETTAAQSASYTDENYLYGYDTATEISNPSGEYFYYTLSTSNDGVLGFWWHEEDGGAFESAAHKAYLALPQGTLNGTSGIKLKKGDGDDTTGISSVEVENEANAVKGIYTLQGVRVSNMNQKGVYIVDGKKVLVK